MARLLPSEPRQTRRVLHPSDFSLLSEHAFAEALRWARADRAGLLLLHVVVPVVPIMGDECAASPWLYPEMNRALCEGATQTLGRLVGRAKAFGVRAEALVLQGLPANQIVHAACSRDVDLIVMGSVGRTGLMRRIFGGLAEEVVARAPCPVLLVGVSARQRRPARRHLVAVGSEFHPVR
jgi:nucleotide-binding universal stress UspA family protein